MWLRDTSRAERRTLAAGFLGYGVDAFDFMVYSFIIPTLILQWGLSREEAGNIATGALLSSAVGGWLAGILADRFGRVRVLQLTVLWFSVFTCLSGFTHGYGQLLAMRTLQGFGFGGEWSVGSVLISETIAARHRGKASGLVQSSWAVGWGLAALAYWGIYAWVPPQLGWKILFWIGIIPALLILYIRRHVKEPPIYLATRKRTPRRGLALGIFVPPLLRTTIWASLLSTGMLGAYYSVTTWLPTYLKSERHLTVTGTSAYLLVLIAGSFAGYLTGASLSDGLGRRRCFIGFAVASSILVLAYLRLPITDIEMLILGFPLGFCLSGIFSGMGAFLTELYPTPVRGSGQGFCYNFGRASSAFCPALIGSTSVNASLGASISTLTVAAYGLVILAALVLPETRGRELLAAV